MTVYYRNDWRAKLRRGWMRMTFRLPSRFTPYALVVIAFAIMPRGHYLVQILTASLLLIAGMQMERYHKEER